MLVIGSTVLGGFLVERGKFLRAEGRLVSCRMFVEHVCVLIAGPLAGYLAGLPLSAVAVIGAAIAVVIVPIAAVCVAEPIQHKSKVVEAKSLLPDLKFMFNSRAMWLVAIFLLVSSIPQSFKTPLYFYQKNTLAFSRRRNWIPHGCRRSRWLAGHRFLSILVPKIANAGIPRSRSTRFLYWNSRLPFLCIDSHCAHR